MPPTLKEFGVKTPEYILQPDYTFSHNGYGLLQLSCNFAVDTSKAGGSANVFPRGGNFPKSAGQLGAALASKTWSCIKAEERGRDGNMAYVSATFAAINDGAFTQTEASITSAVVSEAIESHPNFSRIQVPGIGDGKNPLGGTWVFNVPPDVNNTAVNKYRALWQKTVNVTVGSESYNFVNFAANDSSKPANRKAGVKNWMRPSFNMKMVVYTNNADEAATVCSYIGFITDKKIGGIMAIPDCYKGIGESGLLVNSSDVSKFQQGKRDWLITGANMEVYGGLYKVQADLLLSGVLGWDQDIYPKLSEEGNVQT